MSLVQDDTLGAAEFLSPWHLRERTIGLRVTRFPAGLGSKGAEVDAFRMMSRATFIRHFQERLGRSANDLLTDIRMTVASNALKTPDMPAGAVAELAGYQSEPAFQRAFKQLMGVTPAEWRRNARMGKGTAPAGPSGGHST